MDAGEIRNGMTIEFKGGNGVYQVLEFLHVKPGKGAAFVRTKLKNVISGGVVEKTFSPDETITPAHIDRRNMQYLYSDGDFFYFFDGTVDPPDQVEVSMEDGADSMKFVKEGEMVKICSYEGNVFAIEPPTSVELLVTESEPGVKGNTATGAMKPATVETGAVISVPLFVNEGDTVKIDTRTGEYLKRV